MCARLLCSTSYRLNHNTSYTFLNPFQYNFCQECNLSRTARLHPSLDSSSNTAKPPIKTVFESEWPFYNYFRNSTVRKRIIKFQRKYMANFYTVTGHFAQYPVCLMLVCPDWKFLCRTWKFKEGCVLHIQEIQFTISSAGFVSLLFCPFNHST